MIPARRLLVLASLCAAVGACSRERAAPAIGFTYNFGDTALQNFMQRAVDRSRPANGRPIRVFGNEVSSYQTLAATALSAEVRRATNLAADPDVVITVGPGGSREVLQVAPIYREAKLVDLVPTATSRLLATTGEYSFLLAPNDSVQGAFLAAFADTALHAHRAAIFYVPDEYGIGLSTGTATSLAERGIELLDRAPLRLTLDCLRPEGAAVYRDHAAQLALRGIPEVAIIAARTIEAACLARALHERFPALRVLAGDGTFLSEDFFVRAGTASEGMYLVAFWHPDLPDTLSRAFARAFEAQVGRRVRHGDAVFYDATMLAATAIREAGANRATIHRYLLELGVSRPAYRGITGPITFGPGHGHPLLMTRVRGSASEVVGR